MALRYSVMLNGNNFIPCGVWSATIWNALAKTASHTPPDSIHEHKPPIPDYKNRHAKTTWRAMLGMSTSLLLIDTSMSYCFSIEVEVGDLCESTGFTRAKALVLSLITIENFT